MSDADARLERLERLTRLRDSGALSAEEFAVEKRRVLMGEEAVPPAPPPPPRPAPPREVAVEPERYDPEPYDEVEPAPRRRFPVGKLIAGVAIASAVGALAFINTTPATVPGRSPPKPKPAAASGASGEGRTTARKPGDLSEALRFANARQCVFAPRVVTLFDTLLPQKADGDMDVPPKRVTFAGLDLAVATRITPLPNSGPESRRLNISVKLPEGTRWNALKLSRIVREYDDESDSPDFDTRMLTFLNPVEDVQAALKLAGVDVPVAPQARGLDDSGGPCEGTMQLERVAGGTALSCGWGC